MVTPRDDKVTKQDAASKPTPTADAGTPPDARADAAVVVTTPSASGSMVDDPNDHSTLKLASGQIVKTG